MSHLSFPKLVLYNSISEVLISTGGMIALRIGAQGDANISFANSQFFNGVGEA